MRVSVSYTCPVLVVVDLDTGEVDSVTVMDEHAEVETDGCVENAGTFEPVTPEQAAQALAIAQGDAEWPAWDFGY